MKKEFLSNIPMKEGTCVGRGVDSRNPTFRRVRRGFPAWAFSWGHKNAGGTYRNDTEGRGERAEPKIPKGVRAGCDARGRCHTEDNTFPWCKQTDQVSASLARHDSAGRIGAQSPGQY
jgi:hypothetical protein